MTGGQTRHHSVRTDSKERAVYHWMSGWDWLWMSFTMFAWAVVVGAVVYVAVRLASRPPDGPKAGP